MPVQQTSKAAYDELLPTLTIRQRRVLVALSSYCTRRGVWPTAYELYEAMKADGLANDLNDVRPPADRVAGEGEGREPND